MAGACQCGGLAWHANAWPQAMVRCHCSDCQAQSASAFGLSVYFVPEAVQFSGIQAFFDVPTAANGRKRCVFCPGCGVRVAHIGQPGAKAISIKGGTLRPGHRMRPVADLWTARKLPWVPLLENGLAYAQQPADWSDVETAFAEAMTVEFYSAAATDYAATSIAWDNGALLSRFLSRLPAGGSALDLGCGAGWAAAAMRGAGLRVTAIDASPGLAAEAARRFGLSVRIARMQSLADIAAFDGIWAHYALLHVPRAEWPDMLARIRTALRPGGVLLLAIKEGTVDGPDRLGRFYTRMTAQALAAQLRTAGFEAVSIETTAPAKGYEGSPARGLVAEARRGA